jgi:hypothetical protein
MSLNGGGHRPSSSVAWWMNMSRALLKYGRIS